MTGKKASARIIPDAGKYFHDMESFSGEARTRSNQAMVQSVERAFQILNLLRECNDGLGVSEIASSLSLSTTTTHRLLQTLTGLRVVQQNRGNRHYSLAPHMLLYGKAVLDQFDFVRSAHPLLGDLSKSLGETVFMGILDGFDLVYVDHVDSLDHALRITPQIGRRQPAHCTALGKVLLAGLPDDRLDEFLSKGKLPRLTENTITDADDLRQELASVRRNGYAVDREETEIGICCVSAPVRGMEGRVVAAISVSGPATRLRKKGLRAFLREHVQTTASRISDSIVA